MIDGIKRLYVNALFKIPHGSIYAFHGLSHYTDESITDRRIETKEFYRFIENHGPYTKAPELESGMITFDDGLEDVYTIGYRYLSEKGIPFTAFVLYDMLDTEGYLTTEELMEMSKSPLVTIGSHGLSHIPLAEHDRNTQAREIAQSKEKFEDLLGLPCNWIAYPFGSYNLTTIELTKEAGYEYGFAVDGRPLYRKFNRYAVPRMSVADNTIRKYWNS